MQKKSQFIPYILASTLLGQTLIVSSTGASDASPLTVTDIFSHSILKKRLIIRVLDRDALADVAIDSTSKIQQIADKHGLDLHYVRDMGVEDFYVVELEANSDEAYQQAIKLLKEELGKKYVTEDILAQPALMPNDTQYGAQWSLDEPSGNNKGINVEKAWDRATGKGVVIAVLDTGFTKHPDLNANLLPGYDFISDASNALDGDGRDANAIDEGDADPNNDCQRRKARPSSSWHGTHVAGTAAAVTNNNRGVAGVAYDAKILPIRVLGKCGGSFSDIADAILWASGQKIQGVPDNANPAQVINLSLGGEAGCDEAMQSAIDTARKNGATVITAAGNDSIDATQVSPSACNNVITVAASNREGKMASYSNFGPAIEITAPGGEPSEGILSTINDGQIKRGKGAYVENNGTSMATPHVAGVAAMLYQLNSNITPSQVLSNIQTSAKSISLSDCPQGCGSGLLDAEAAIKATLNEN